MSEPYRGASNFNKMNFRQQLAILESACRWLSIPSGRAHDYQRLIKEFWEGRPRTEEHIFVHNESYEIVDLYEVWNQHADHFPGLKGKIAAAVGGGPILTQNERASTSSNRPRNDAFVYLFAGELIQAGIEVVAVDGILRNGETCHATGDITFKWEGAYVDVQCKRPQTAKAVVSRIKEARRQIEDMGEIIVGGIIAVDFSAFIRPTGKLIEKASSNEALDVCRTLLEQWKPVAEKELRAPILGFYLHARVPAMIVVQEFRVLTISGRPYREYRPDSITTSIIIENRNCRAPGIVSAVHDRLSAVLS